MQSSANSHWQFGEGPPPSPLSPSIGHPTQLPASSYEPPLLNTKDLFAVCKLLSENINIICSIKNKIKQYENESESENSSGLDEEDATPKKAFYCLICDIPFSNSHSLTDHFGANHTGPNGVELPNVEPLKLDKYCLENSSHVRKMKKATNQIIVTMEIVNQKQINILRSIEIIGKKDIQEQMLPKLRRIQSWLDQSSEWFLMEKSP